MEKRYRVFRVLPVLAVVFASVCYGRMAHPDLELRIEAATKQIQQHPGNAQLYFDRGELHLQHEDWDAAMADFESVLQLDPAMDRAQVARAVALLKGGWPKSAKVVLDVYLRDHAEDATALLTRGRALAAAGEHLSAAQDYTRAIKYLSDPKPDYYLERAGEYILAGDAHLKDALNGIDEGIERFGPLVTLELYAIDLELKLGHVDQALTRLDAVGKQSQRKEGYLIRRGKILEEAQRIAQARSAYEAGLAAIRKLPLRFRKSKATNALEAQAVKALARLDERHPVKNNSKMPAPKPD